MKKIDHSIVAIFGVNLIATAYSIFSPALAVRLPDIYLATVGGMWAKYQMESSREDDEHGGN